MCSGQDTGFSWLLNHIWNTGAHLDRTYISCIQGSRYEGLCSWIWSEANSFYISTCYIYAHRTHYIHLETSLWSTGINSSRWSQKSQTYWNTAARWFRPGIVSLWIQKRLRWLETAKIKLQPFAIEVEQIDMNMSRNSDKRLHEKFSIDMFFILFWFFWRVFNCFQSTQYGC